MAEKLTIELNDADLRELREWASNSEQPVEALLSEAVQQYMRTTRADHAELDRRMQGPFYTTEEVRQRLAERRRLRAQAAE
jgi:predicted transcriptional regulator